MTKKPVNAPAPRWLNGEPYYCNSCGLGGAEVMACEDGPCEMETREQAQARREQRAAISRAEGR